MLPFGICWWKNSSSSVAFHGTSKLRDITRNTGNSLVGPSRLSRDPLFTLGNDPPDRWLLWKKNNSVNNFQDSDYNEFLLLILQTCESVNPVNTKNLPHLCQRINDQRVLIIWQRYTMYVVCDNQGTRIDIFRLNKRWKIILHQSS